MKASSLVRLWQAGGALVLFGLGTAAGVQVEWAGGERLGFFAAAYRSVQTFLVNVGSLPEGGPVGWRAVMTAVCFLAPVLSGAVLLQGLVWAYRSLRGPEGMVRRMKRPTIVCGYGKHGQLVARKLVEKWCSSGRPTPQPEVVVVDCSPSLGDSVEVTCERGSDPRHHVSLPVVHGHMGVEAFLFSEPKTAPNPREVN